MNLQEHGCCLVPSSFSEDALNTLRDTLFQDHSAGERCLPDHPAVRETALALKRELTSTEPKHRRILHLVYHSGEPIPETWHRAI